MQQYQKRHGSIIEHMWLIVSILTICGGMANSLQINSDDNRMDRTFDSGNQLAKLIINQRLKRSGSNGNGPCNKGNKGDVGCPCTTNTDCSTNICHQGKCKPSTCFDSIRNSHETDVDCGGGTCSACAGGKICKVGTDCQSGDCQSGTCKPLVTCDTCVVNNFGGYANGLRCTEVCAVATAYGSGGDILFHNVTSGSSGQTLINFLYGFYAPRIRHRRLPPLPPRPRLLDDTTLPLRARLPPLPPRPRDRRDLSFPVYSGGDYVGNFLGFDGSIINSYTYGGYTFNVYATSVTYTGSCAGTPAAPNCGSDGLFAFPCGGGVGHCCCGITNP